MRNFPEKNTPEKVICKPLKKSGWSRTSFFITEWLKSPGKWQRMARAAAASFLIFAAGCGTIKKVEIEHRIETHYVDSTIYHLDTIKVEVPREVYMDYAGLLDTLRLETSVASSWAAVDTTNMVLKGELKNKDVALEKEIHWKERIVYRDSLVYQEIPVPVEVIKEVTPRWAWFSLGVSIFFILGFILFFLIKLKLV